MKTQILLLHGALGSATEFQDISNSLSDDFDVKCLNFPGHQGEAFVDGTWTVEVMCNFLNNFIHQNFHRDSGLIVFGHSMGGYLALCSLLQENPTIDAAITLGTKMHWDPDIAAREISMLDPMKMQSKVPAFVENLKQVHGADHWQKLVFQIGGFLHELGQTSPISAENVRGISKPCRIMLGDRDRMVSMDETLDIFKAIPNATLSILPNTPHPLIQAETARICFEIREVASQLAN
ncbi:MAG: alpha/beta hydrolase [Bacteroidetes bacterium]|nr:alpha/beta hydrolase [Bacteroidota bacterium]